MRELNFMHDIDYRRVVTATFSDGTDTWTRDCVICADYDEDDDSGLTWYSSMEDLEHDPDFVECGEPATALCGV